MIVLSHRGLDLGKPGFAGESTRAAFETALASGFGLEVDLQMCADGSFLLWHDYDLRRWTRGRQTGEWQELSSAEIRSLEGRFGQLCWWDDLIVLHARYPDAWIAVHVKAHNQTDLFLGRWRDELRKLSSREKILAFDLFPSVARELRDAFSDLGLAVSVANDFDVKRFTSRTGGTLSTLDEALDRVSGVCDWLWFDEWDRKAADGSVKDLYSPEVVLRAHEGGFKLAAISPELHAQDGHEDASSAGALEERWRRIRAAGIDAICTDYPTRLIESL